MSNTVEAFKHFTKIDYPASLLGDALEQYPSIILKDSLDPSLLADPSKNFDVCDFNTDQKSKYKNNYKRIFNPNHVLSPFSASLLIEEPSERVWIYIDEFDVIQGPFTTNEMDYWYNNKCFPMDLLMGLADRERSIRLGDFILSTYPFAKTGTSASHN